MYRASRGAAWRAGVESSGDWSVCGVVKTRGMLAQGSDMTVAEKKGPRPRYGPRMLQVTAYVRDHPGESSNSVSYATGPHGNRIHGQKAVNRALSASLIEDRGTGRAFELHITDTGRDALEAVWPHYADAHTWKATDVQALDPRFIEVTHRDSADISHDPPGVISTGTTWTGLPVRFWLPRESYWALRDAFNANGILWIEVPDERYILDNTGISG
jgi:hypothetical protein